MTYSAVLISVLILNLMPFLVNGITYNCPIDESYTEYTRATKYSSYSQAYHKTCGWLGWKRCTSYKKKYRKNTYLEAVVKTRKKDACCPGFIGTYPYCIPQCQPGCATQNGGLCRYNPTTQQKYCDCQHKGWTGTECSIDINECAASSSPCPNLATCQNTAGGYNCICQSGLELDAANNYDCIDINEYTNGEHTCHSELYCTNTRADYTCDCPSGYQVNLTNPKRCNDINECTKEYAFGGCEQNCINTPGFFKCSCESGYDKNWYDYRKCEDIDECKWELHNCEDLCFNSPGSYKCGCRQGCELSNDNETCTDVNECDLQISGCSQNCINKNCFDGKYSCLCFDGYELDADEKNCKNINECLDQNGGCEHNCTDTEGSYECSCEMGYALKEDQHSCQAMPCGTLESPLYSSMECTSNDPVVGDSCIFSCDKDYVLSGSKFRNCLPSTSWSGETSTCSIVKCPILIPKEHSRIISRCSMDLNSTCILTCENGYYTEGSTIHIQSCKYSDEDKQNPVWSSPPICTEVNICDPNPCENGGVCSPLDDNTPSCSCPKSSIKGELCEQIKIEVDDIPILAQEKLSDPIFIHANPVTTIYIEVIVDSTIKVFPSGSISITSPATSASFQLQASAEGIFEVSYEMSTTDPLVPPDNQIIVVSNADTTDSGYYTGLSAPVRGLSPGCCMIKTQIECLNIPQLITLSSSCGWSTSSNQFKTSGVVFAHIGSLSLPLSTAGIQFHNSDRTITQINQDKMSCSRCSSASPNADSCFEYLPNINDIAMFMERQALVDEFYQSVASILPPTITMRIFENANKAELHASILTSIDALIIEGCQDLDVQSSKAYHVLNTKQGLQFTYLNEQIVYENRDLASSLCFATDVCDNDVIHISGLTNEANNQLNGLQSFKAFLESGWSIKFNYLSLFQNEQMSPSNSYFWNGNAFFKQDFSIFNIKTRLRALGNLTGSHLSVNIIFEGIILSTLSNVSSEYCDKEFNGELTASVNMDIGGVPSILTMLSSDVNGYMKSCLGSTVSEVSSVLMFSPRQSSNEIIDFLYSHEQCKVNAYIKYDNSLVVESISLQSKCMAMKFEGLEFNDMNTIIDITSELFPVGNGVFSNVIVKSSVESVTQLGSFIMLYPMSLVNVQFTVFNNVPGKFGIIQNANISLFESNYVSNILISSDEGASFKIDNGVMYTDYPVTISGTIDTKMAWNEAHMNINIEYLELHTEVESFVKEQLQDEASIALSRLEFCANSKLSVINKISDLENKQSDLEQQVNSISDKLELKLKYQRKAEFIKDQIHNRTIELFEEYKNLIDSVDGNCTIEPCDKVCMDSGKVSTVCFAPNVKTSKRPCTDTVFVDVNITGSEVVTKCKCIYEWSCDRQKHNSLGAALSVAGVVASAFIGPSIGVFGLVAGFLSSLSKKCDYHCHRVSYDVTEYYTKKVQIKELRTILCNYSKVVEPPLKYKCNFTSSCKYFKDENRCVSLNVDCAQAKWKVIKSFQDAENGTAKLLQGQGNTYQEATNEQTKLGYEITLIKIDEVNLNNELNEVMLLHEAAVNLKTIVSQSCAQIEEDVKTGIIVDELINSKGIDNLVQINSATSDISFWTETPVIFPVDISYSIPFLNTSFATSINVDMSSLKDIVIEKIGLSLNDEIISSYTGTKYRRKRDNHKTINDYFITKCYSLEDVLSYYQLIIDTLTTSQGIASSTIINLFEEQTKATQSLNELLVSDVFGNNSNFSEIVIAGETNYTEKYVTAIDRMSRNLNDSVVSNWQTLMEEIHNDTIDNVANRSCFTFADCLAVSLNEINHLLFKMPTEFVNEETYSQYSTIHNLSSIATSRSINTDEIIDIVTNVILVLNEISNIGFWCATKPNVVVNPVSNISVHAGDSFSLICEANSTLPITYKWRQNGKYINQDTNALFVSSAKISNGGIYYCEMSNSVGTTRSENATVSVFEIPQFNTELRSLITFVGASSIQFVCDVSGYPEIEYAWFFWPDNTTAWIEMAIETNSSLILSDIKSSDEGWYKCQAANVYGNISSDAAQLLVVSSKNVKICYIFRSVFTIHEAQLITSNEDSYQQMVYNWYIALIENGNISISTSKFEIISNDTLSIQFAISHPQNETGKVHVVDSAIQEIQSLEKAKYNLIQGLTSPFQLGNESMNFTALSSEIKLMSYKFDCPKGYRFEGSDSVCVLCSPGTFWNGYITKVIQPSPGDKHTVRYSICSSCPLGQYQNQSGSIKCNKCPMNRSSVVEGSNNIDSCKESCKSGMYSQSGLEPCDTCEKGYYQSERGKTFCSVCSNTTVNDQCAVLCGVDHYSGNGMKPCNKCSTGEEQPLIGQSNCISCNKNSTSLLCTSALSFDKKSPIVSDTNITVYLKRYNLQSSSCYVSYIGKVNCSSGIFVLTGLEPNIQYQITLNAVDILGKKITVKRKVVPKFPEQCSVHLINNGITVHDNRIMVEFAAVDVSVSGTDSTARCTIDGYLKPCKSPVVFHDVIKEREFTLIIIPDSTSCKRFYGVFEKLKI